ncbi:hypothetical protein OKW40_003530 [Paraburkholderia sp. RAU6.4a]|uniref:hypothetical protein n=1 Tax=Paraburkholderia sp. RAU6.4a TaxID=2991067 RepID=UPI003D203FAC
MALTNDELSSATGDTLLIAAKPASYKDVFVGQRCWYPVRIDDKRLRFLKWIAVYQGRPVSAITSYAKIEKIEPYLESGRYKVFFSAPIDLPDRIEMGDNLGHAIQGHRYTTLDKLRSAKSIKELKPWD